MTVAIIDHETMTEIGPTDETMALRVVPEGGFRGDIAKSEVLEYRPPRERPEPLKQCKKEFRVDYPTLERRMRWAGPFPVRPVHSMTGRLSVRKPKLADVPRDDEPVGVEQESDDDTSTFALPAVWKMTGKPSTNKLAHRSAAHVQRIFNEAGWNLAVWFGETTRSYWVMDENGLHEFDSITSMYRGMGWEVL